MSAYFQQSFRGYIACKNDEVIGALQKGYADDGFASQYTKQTKAWNEIVHQLKVVIKGILDHHPEIGDWIVVLEYPLYRLRKRIDVVILAGTTIVVIECKVGSNQFSAEDRRQVEEYALDLRDFHAASANRRIIPVLWSSDHKHSKILWQTTLDQVVAPVVCVGNEGLSEYLLTLRTLADREQIDADEWNRSPYKPVPSVIEAATSIFAGHSVRSITNADAANLRMASSRLLALIHEARESSKRYLLLLTGIPGSGKTLAGLNVVHSASSNGSESRGDIIYLSGNTPLVVVLREALARDEYRRCEQKRTLKDIRRDVCTRIQHINDFLQEGFRTAAGPPHEHVIVFDEAQRAWDETQGKEKFDRAASEPSLLLELMTRHPDWCVCVCLIGVGQEINSGEEGILGWGKALRKLDSLEREQWTVFASPDALQEGPSIKSDTLGLLPVDIKVREEPDLRLSVSQRSYRSPKVSRWVDCVLTGDDKEALLVSRELGHYPVMLTRSLNRMKMWLREHNRGQRRFGLVASSGARRLRAEGLGEYLKATDKAEIAHWYLNELGDIRSSYALEVPANEYTCQGLELDLVGVCWGGDYLWDESKNTWSYARLSGTAWQQVRNNETRRYLENSYRVLLTRAREGLILWIPEGDDSDSTRKPAPLDATAAFLLRCGATFLDLKNTDTK